MPLKPLIVPQAAKSVPPSTVWDRLRDVPHRALFSQGVLAVLLLLGWWMWALLAKPDSLTPPSMVHAVLSPLGLFPLFMLGFLFTAGPRWLGVDGPQRLFPMGACYLLGLALSLFGFSHRGSWPAPGLILMLCSWLLASWRWQQCIARSRAGDTQHARAIWLAMLMGGLSLALALGWVLSEDARWWLFARSFALWAFLLPVFLTVCHRMLPFFTQAALPQHLSWRPYWLLYSFLLASVLLAITQAMEWMGAQLSVALLFAGLLTFTSWRWGLWASRSNRLLAMLHLSFAWLPITVALQALLAIGVVSSAAPAHALGLGFCLTMLVGFVTRVTLGHSGRPLQADNIYWAIYLALHGVALIRLALALQWLPPSWMAPSSVLLLGLLLAWAARVLPIYIAPRQDGKAG